MIHGWRIVKARHVHDAFSGEGARLYGGRWNSKGTAVVYVAGSASLAVLEMLVHLESHEILHSYFLAEVVFEASLVATVDVRSLPVGWRSDPSPMELKDFGDEWVARGESAVFRIPSALVEVESNFLLNPAHPDFAAIRQRTPQPFRSDPRLIKAT